MSNNVVANKSKVKNSIMLMLLDIILYIHILIFLLLHVLFAESDSKYAVRRFRI